MEDLVVACPLLPTVPHLVSGSCSSPRTFAPRFLQTPPHGDALALHLSFGSTSAWTGDFHPPAVRHARHTRPSSADRALFARFGWSALLGSIYGLPAALLLATLGINAKNRSQRSAMVAMESVRKTSVWMRSQPTVTASIAVFSQRRLQGQC